MSTDNIAGYALGGEFNAINFLKLLCGDRTTQQRKKIYGSRKAIRRVLKARKEQESSNDKA